MANTARRKRRALEELRERVASYLVAHPCVDCGEADLRVLDFDHVDPATKLENISVMVLNVWSWDNIEMELSKCVVRCANCHRRRTAETRMQWRHRWMVENRYILD